jgi:hypothetical protein
LTAALIKPDAEHGRTIATVILQTQMSGKALPHDFFTNFLKLPLTKHCSRIRLGIVAAEVAIFFSPKETALPLDDKAVVNCHYFSETM